jgi:hypothetical protein
MENEMFEGYKSYIVAFMVALIAVLEGIVGIDIPGAQMQSDWFNWVLAALGLGALRSSVAKAEAAK